VVVVVVDGLAVVEFVHEVEELTTVEAVAAAAAPLMGGAGQAEKGTCPL
jgi:hypothetical protein